VKSVALPVWIVAASVAASATVATLGDAVIAQGVITWLLFMAASQLGAGTYLSRKRKPGERLREAPFAVSVRALGWGLTVALFGTGYEVRPEFVGVAVFVAGLGAEWLTEAVFVLAVQFARNPLQFIDDFRMGRAARRKREDDGKEDY
jgi:hypothetical protein